MKLLWSFLLGGICFVAIAQNKIPPHTKIDSSNFDKLYPYALRGDMRAVFEILEMAHDSSLTQDQKNTKKGYYQRFLYRTEDFNYNTDDPVVMDLFKRFQNYWRSIIIENVTQKLADSLFRGEMTYFLKKYVAPDLSIERIDKEYYTLFQDFFKSKDMHGIAMGKTGHLFDLYLWKDQERKEYSIDLPEGQTVEVPIVFMRNFISNGWSHYTTFGHSFSGGWATSKELFCVEESYGPKDGEEFLISYVSHEGQHFADYKIFPKLKQADLEFRAKLTELSLARETTYEILKKFITNAKNDTSYAHPYANYRVIEFLSQKIMKSDFEPDLEKWKRISTKEINRVALKLLKEHSKKLKSMGAESVEAYITTI
ncbi:hypothetical protein [Ulvibacterium sp.]|uniref:hypothetical protein n=1 Tax=Ulvibacterium sp. TaxID=2665914 RepID=UPI003BABFBB2